MDKPLVSVIVPTYNRAYCLEKTIDSVLAQTYQYFEIIVIDDGSIDDTQALFTGRYDGESRIKYFRQPNGGISAARNSGIRKAIGKYIAFCDSDDIWSPDKLAVQVACLEKFPEVGLVWTDLTAVDPNGEKLFERYTRIGYPTWALFSMEQLFNKSCKLSALVPALPDGDVYVGDIFTAMIVGTLINMPTVIVTSECIDQIGFFNEAMKVGEDYDFNLRACCAAPAAFIDIATIDYRIGAPDQLTRPELLVDQARNSLLTLYPVVERFRKRIRLSGSELNKVFADRYRWLGQTEFDAGNYGSARAAFLKSLRHQPLQPKLLALIAAALLPPQSVMHLRGNYQKLKARLR